MIEVHFLAVELDLGDCVAEARWLRQVSKDECERGPKVALGITLELKKELRKTLALVRA